MTTLSHMYRPKLADRPPWKPPGRNSTRGGRAHLKLNSKAAKAIRLEKATRAVYLRLTGKLSIRDIATAIGVSPATVGRWLIGIYPETCINQPFRRNGANMPRTIEYWRQEIQR